jgi:hypothetical protein
VKRKKAELMRLIATNPNLSLSSLLALRTED